VELEGTILAGPEFEPLEGRVVVEDGEIVAVEETATASTDVVAPAFVNAHTHVGDSVAKDAATGLGLQEAVAPPDSRKHRRLADASRAELVTAMRRSMRFMEQGGTAAFLDFREQGVEGAETLVEAAGEVPVEALVMGSGPAEVLAVADGYGASGANDDDFTAERAAARDAGKPFAIHAGEPDDTDIHPALDYDPAWVVHMVHAGPEHLRRVAEESVPVVACPRTNAVLDVGTPPMAALVEHTTVALGTDNVMLNAPTMFREMEYVAKRFDIPDRTVLAMATRNGAEVAGLDCGVVEAGRPAKLAVLDGDSHNLAGTVDPISAVVRRAGVADVKRTVL
jgi:cytosine/adenosine deaminase-related metal-dependent hydrolase